MAYLTIEVVRTEDLTRLNIEQALLKLARLDHVDLGHKARLAGLKVSDEELSMNTGIVSFEGSGRAVAYGIFMMNMVQDVLQESHAFVDQIARRRINGVNYTIATGESAIVFKLLILCELLQGVI